MIKRLHSQRHPGLFRYLSSTAAVVFLLAGSAFIAHHHDPARITGDNGPQCQLCLQVGSATPLPALELTARVPCVVTRAPRVRHEEPVVRLVVHAYLSRGPPAT